MSSAKQLVAGLGLALAGFFLFLLFGLERPPPTYIQRGYRGTGMQTVYNPRLLAKVVAANQAPPVLIPPAASDGPRASQVYKNVQVLGDLSVGELTRVMLSITQWVAPPEQSCGYCHGADMADDSLYTKKVARRMLAMVREINGKWSKHVAQTGVTCYTCHHGQQVPAYAWYTDPGPGVLGSFVASRGEQNVPAAAVGLSSLPYDPMTPLLAHDGDIRVDGNEALPAGNYHSIKQAEWTYGLMMYISGSLGVNCTYCHNTHSFRDWDTSPPQRVTAWYGIRMVRALNRDYLLPLAGTVPASRLGPTGDIAKVGCATCHRGAFKPLFGAPVLKDYPELGPPRGAPPPAGAHTAQLLTGADAVGARGN